MFRQGFFEHHVAAQGATATANSSGVAVATYGPVPQGYCWYIERYSVHCPTAAAVAAVNVTTAKLTTSDPYSRVDYTTAGADAAGDSFSAIYIPEGYFFNVVWTAATNADVCTASIQYAVHQLDPHTFESPEDYRQEAAAHQKATAPVTHTAVAGERAV